MNPQRSQLFTYGKNAYDRLLSLPTAVTKYRYIIIVIMMCNTLSIFDLYGQCPAGAGIIINEVSNGPSGSKEWVELLVVGNPSTPTANVDLAGWIYDDNNGDFEGSGGGKGISQGHLSFGPSWTAVPPGSLIIIYNEADIDPALPAADPTDSNSDGVYILPADHTSLLGCSSLPTSSDPSYLPCTNVAPSWSRVAMGNGGDVSQVRKPDGTFFHGFSYGNVGAPFPTFPCGTSSWNIGAGGGGTTFIFGCGDWDSASNFSRITSGSTPGVPNAATNGNFIGNTQNGTLDYANLSNSTNCSSVIPPVGPSTITLQKSVTNTNPNEGEIFNFILDAACNSTSGDCENVVIRDTLPGVVQFLNFSYPLPDGVSSATYDITSREIVVLFDATTCVSCSPDGIGDEDDFAQGSSIQLLVQVQFPEGSIDGSQAINTAYITSDNAGSSSSTATSTVSSGYIAGDFPDSKRGDNSQIQSGYQYWSIEVGNIGFSDIESYVVIDTIPDTITLDQVRTPEFTGLDHSGSLSYQRSDNPGLWIPWTSFNMNSRQTLYVSGLGLPPGEKITTVRLELGTVLSNGLYNPFIYPDGFGRQWVLYGQVPASLQVGDSYTNCAHYTGVSNGSAISDVDCITTDMIAPVNQITSYVYPMDTNQVELNTFSIEDTMLVAVTYASPGLMGFDVVGGVMSVILPPGVEYVPGSWFMAWGEDNADYQVAALETEVLVDGRELIRFVFDSTNFNSFTIPPTGSWEGFRIIFESFIDPATSEGDHTIEFYSNATHSFPDNCDIPDVNNYLGGYASDMCNNNYDITIVRPPSSAGLQSIIEVIGTLDNDYSRYPDLGLTVPGGVNDYRIKLKNPNAADIDSLIFITVLPHVGDTEVLDSSVPRYSEWSPSLVNPVVPPADLNVEYSIVSNPCRDELAGSNPTPFPSGCNTPNWNATPPTDITTVTALRFSYDAVLSQNDSVVVSWPMRAPVNTLPDTSIAWNSFGYTGRNADLGVDLLPAEPIKVGIELRPGNVPIVGDFVWDDLNENGLQDIAEPGIDGVLVELYHDVNGNGIQEPDGPDTLELYTRTAAGGYYLFSDFDYGYYFLQFSDLPSGYSPTFTKLGPDSLDSEGPLTDVILFDNTVDTRDVDLGIISGELPSFPCATDIYLSSSTGSNMPSQLYTINTTTSPFALDSIGSSANHNYNALGYREQDGFLYAIKLETNQLIRIDSLGTQLNLGAIIGLPAPASLGDSYDGGDVFPDGYLYVHEVGNHDEMYQIDVASSPPSLVATHTLSQNIWLSDFAYSPFDNKVYGVGDQGDKYMIDPNTWNVTTVGTSTTAASYGAAYADDLGNIYVYRNNPGAFFKVEFGTNGSGPGTMILISSGPNVAFNDGASCRGTIDVPLFCRTATTNPHVMYYRPKK